MQKFFHFIKNKRTLTLNRFIFTTFKCYYEDVKVIKPYLLNRIRPACDILKSLEKDELEELKTITNEYNYMLVSNGSVPSHLTDENYLDLLCLKEKQRVKYFRKLLKIEKSLLRKSNPISKVTNNNENDSPVITNRFISKFKKDDLMSSNRLYHAMVLKSQEVVIDLSFESMMNLNSLHELGNNLARIYYYNKTLKDPLQLIFTQFQPGTFTYSAISNSFSFPFKHARKIEDLLLVLSGQHYLDLFPNRRLVYLSPNSRNHFQHGEFDHEAVYIIGGLVEKAREVPVTLGRARAEKIEHRAFPIDECLDWKAGSKSLDIRTAFQILAAAQQSDGDWRAALGRHVPSKHLTEPARTSSSMKILENWK